jgi:hypothetical protein
MVFSAALLDSALWWRLCLLLHPLIEVRDFLIQLDDFRVDLVAYPHDQLGSGNWVTSG